MYNNYDYPLGADTPDAPWNNDEELPKKEYEITCSQSLSRTFIVSASEGENASIVCKDTHYTPLELIIKLKNILKEYLDTGSISESPRNTELLIEECNNWIDDETEFIEN